jgi:hypothetical protein
MTWDLLININNCSPKATLAPLEAIGFIVAPFQVTTYLSLWLKLLRTNS